MIQNVITAEEPSWGDDGKMEYWNDGTLGRIDSNLSSFNALFHCSNHPLFRYLRSRWRSFFMQRSMTTFNPALLAFSPASL